MNKYEKMEIVSFDDIEDVYGTIGIELMHLEDEEDYIAVYGKIDLNKELCTTMNTDGYEFRYADFDTQKKKKKDMIYMMFIHGNCVISVEPAYSNNGVVIGHDAKVALFYMDDCKQDVIDYCVKRDMKVTLFDFDEDICECEREYENKCENKCSHGCDDTEDKNVYTVTVKCNLDTDEAEKIIAEMEKRVEHMHDMFVEMDAFRRIFRW